MDCRQIEKLWLQLPLDLPESAGGSVGTHGLRNHEASIADGFPDRSLNADSPEMLFQLISDHLAHCQDCREMFAIERRWNLYVAERMRDVPVPERLIDAIKQSLAAELVDDPVAPLASSFVTQLGSTAASENLLSRRRLIRWGTLAATGLAALGGTTWWLQDSWNSHRVSLEGLALRLTDPDFVYESLPPFAGESLVLPTTQEMRIPADLATRTPPRGVAFQGVQIAALYQFPTPSVPDQPIAQAFLLIVDLQKARVDQLPPARSFSQAEHLYFNDRAVKFWASPRQIFCCFTTGRGTASLDMLRPQIISS